ncbi:hypothetical protein T484DRAFT_1903759 [Baffinella frigidus]|nr:hypothetical protein T484DRAFT_1903759 [Cryptophyta sp. CCMP2293]
MYRGEGSCVVAWNTGALHASGQVLMAAADDFAAPPAWDRGILERTPAFASAQLLIRDAISAPRVTAPCVTQ